MRAWYVGIRDAHQLMSPHWIVLTQLAKSFDMELIKEARILPGDPTMFDLIMEDGHDHIRLQGTDEHNTHEWSQVINKQISDVRVSPGVKQLAAERKIIMCPITQ